MVVAWKVVCCNGCVVCNGGDKAVIFVMEAGDKDVVFVLEDGDRDVETLVSKKVTHAGDDRGW